MLVDGHDFKESDQILFRFICGLGHRLVIYADFILKILRCVRMHVSSNFDLGMPTCTVKTIFDLTIYPTNFGYIGIKSVIQIV